MLLQIHDELIVETSENKMSVLKFIKLIFQSWPKLHKFSIPSRLILISDIIREIH